MPPTDVSKTNPTQLQKRAATDDALTREANHAVAGPAFARRFGRAPLAPADPRASINDLIFDWMIDPDWSALTRAFVDKEAAKAEAQRLCPNLAVAETLHIIPVAETPSVAALFAELEPFAGSDAIAKPTHASGVAIPLCDLREPAQLSELLALASRDYALALREMQYHGLPRKIIVERMIAGAGGRAPDDYKFHCMHGEPLLCQVDHDRKGVAWSRLLQLPDLAPFDPADGLAPPGTFRLPAPDRIARMIAAARAFSAPFAFVRVDLYDGADDIYFGELTFSPAAALGIAPSAQGDHAVNPTHEAYSARMMRAFRKGQKDIVHAGTSITKSRDA